MKRLLLMVAFLVSLSTFAQSQDTSQVKLKDTTVKVTKTDSVYVPLIPKQDTIKNMIIVYLGEKNIVRYDNGYVIATSYVTTQGQYIQTISQRAFVGNRELKKEEVLQVINLNKK